MSTLNYLFDLPEQICYVQCGFCATILLVSVPCSSLSRLVTVRCGHCSCLLSVNMIKASFLPFHLLDSADGQNNDQGFQEKDQEISVEEVEKVKDPGLGDVRGPSMLVSNNSGNEEKYTDSITLNHIVKKPPEKRQRAPSAYNRFIKEEIQRLKAENPSMAHKEAFSTAAKNIVERALANWSERIKMLDGTLMSLIRSRKTAENFVREKPQGSPYGQGHHSSEGMACCQA